MARERHYEAQGPFSFTSNGGTNGLITLNDVGLLKVKQTIKLSSTTQPNLQVQVKRVLSPTQILVGPIDSNLETRLNVSAYTVADMATVFFSGDSKPKLKVDDIWQAVYEQEPTVAIRTIGVDQFGRPWSSNNPVPVGGTLTAIVDLDKPDKQQVQNIFVPLKDVEFAISLPFSTKAYRISIRNNETTARIAFNSGDTASNYRTLYRGTSFDAENLNLPINSNIYMRTDKDAVTVEIVCWYK